MNTKKIEQLVRSYLYFTAQEKKGVFALLLVLVSVILIPRLYARFFAEGSPPLIIKDLSYAEAAGPSFAESGDKKALFMFDPNHCPDGDLIALGFTENNIATVKKFLEKGGRFKKPGDLGKLYGIDHALAKKLMPFIQLAGASVSDSSSARKIKLKYPVELNAADSETLVALYRIGPGLAHRILEYRTQLGGFVSIEQLTELWGFDEDILYDLKDKIRVDPKRARHIELNNAGTEELKAHPYFKYKLSNAIVNYRRQHGSFKTLADLKKLTLVNDSVYKRISLYLYIE